MGALKGSPRENVEIRPAIIALKLQNRLPPTMVNVVVVTSARRAAQLPVVKIFHQMDITPFFIQQIVNCIFHFD